MVVGKNAASSYSGVDVGSIVRMGGQTWTVVGLMDSGGSSGRLRDEYVAQGTRLRDEFRAFEAVCRDLDVSVARDEALLTEAAAWSSDVERFPPARSTRALLLDRAQRFGSPPSP